MSNLTVTTNSKNLSPSLVGIEKEVAKAYGSVAIFKEKKANVANLVQNLINRAAIESGMNGSLKLSKVEKLMLIDGIVDLLQSKKWLKIEEVDLIFKLGARSDLGEFHGISVRTVNNWCNVYFEKNRKEALKKQMQYEADLQHQREEEKRKRDYEEAKKNLRASFIARYNELKVIKKAKIKDLSIDYNDIPADIDNGNVFFEKFRTIICEWLDKELMQKIKDEEYQKIKKGLIGRALEDSQVQNMAISASRSRALRMHLVRLLTQDVNIKDYLNDHGI